MGWRSDEVWLDTEVLWFREQPERRFVAPALASPALAGFPDDWLAPVATGLDASRRRRVAAQSERRRRLATRTVPAVALVVGSASMLSFAALRNAGAQELNPLLEDPPSLTFGLDTLPSSTSVGSRPGATTPPSSATPTPEVTQPKIRWNRATSVGLPFGGHLLDGTMLPSEGPDWVTWNPVTDSVPNAPGRLYGNERTIRKVLSVVAAYRTAHPAAPRVLVGDISWRNGGRMEQHVSHQNGLDVDVYYPRRDRLLSAPVHTNQIDRRLTQDLLDRFLAAGAQIVFVGYSTRLSGPSGVVVPYPNHENHMHVRFPTRSAPQP